MYTKEEALKRIQEGLNCSIEEAQEVYEYDQKIEHSGAKDKQEFDLTPEQEKNVKQWTKTGTRKTPPAYNFKPRERKANTTKASIIEQIFNFLLTVNEYENITVTNKERQIAFSSNGSNFELTLVQKREKK